MKPLSPSRIKTLKECTWRYWCSYHLKLPDNGNSGADMGTICHLVFECLGNPRHRHHYKKILKEQDIHASPAVIRLINKHIKFLPNLTGEDNYDKILEMTLAGLNYDFDGTEVMGKKPSQTLQEVDFDFEKDEEGKKYRVRGFIDRLFIYKKSKTILMRDYKSSKRKFEGSDLDFNIQDMIYTLALRELYPDFLKRKAEFVFLQFLPDNGSVIMEENSEEVLDGVEFFLTGIQKLVDNMDEYLARSKMAANKGFPKDGTFGGLTMCGKAKYRGEPKKDGTPMWHCQFKFPFDYYVVVDEKNQFVKSFYEEEELEACVLAGQIGGDVIKKHYEGCPAFRR